jgi:hypothetical protein
VRSGLRQKWHKIYTSTKSPNPICSRRSRLGEVAYNGICIALTVDRTRNRNQQRIRKMNVGVERMCQSWRGLTLMISRSRDPCQPAKPKDNQVNSDINHRGIQCTATDWRHIQTRISGGITWTKKHNGYTNTGRRADPGIFLVPTKTRPNTPSQTSH